MDFSAYAGVGVIIDMKKKTVPIASCLHQERVGNVFCPVCGTKVGTTQAPALNEAYDLIDELPDGYVVTEVGFESRKFFVGYGASANDETPNRRMNAPDNSTIQGILETLLEPKGLYDPATFGLHSVAHYS